MLLVYTRPTAAPYQTHPRSSEKVTGRERQSSFSYTSIFGEFVETTVQFPCCFIKIDPKAATPDALLGKLVQCELGGKCSVTFTVVMEK